MTHSYQHAFLTGCNYDMERPQFFAIITKPSGSRLWRKNWWTTASWPWSRDTPHRWPSRNTESGGWWKIMFVPAVLEYQKWILVDNVCSSRARAMEVNYSPSSVDMLVLTAVHRMKIHYPGYVLLWELTFPSSLPLSLLQSFMATPLR